LYEVGTCGHWTSLKFDLPSRAEAFSFHALVNVEWWVTDSTKVVKNGVKDIREALSPPLNSRLSAITRQFDVEDTAAAEAKALESLTDQPIGEEYGLCSRVSLRMQMDEPTVAHEAAIRQVRREIKLELETQELRLLREESTTTLITKRVERYRNIILNGDYDQFALQLAQNPHEVATVVQMLHDERHDKRRNVTDFVIRLLDSGAIERYEVEDQLRVALGWLKENIDTVFRGPEQPAGRPGRLDPNVLPPIDIPESGLPDPPLVDPVRPPGAAPTHDAGKP